MPWSASSYCKIVYVAQLLPPSHSTYNQQIAGHPSDALFDEVECNSISSLLLKSQYMGYSPCCLVGAVSSGCQQIRGVSQLLSPQEFIVHPHTIAEYNDKCIFCKPMGHGMDSCTNILGLCSDLCNAGGSHCNGHSAVILGKSTVTSISSRQEIWMFRKQAGSVLGLDQFEMEHLGVLTLGGKDIRPPKDNLEGNSSTVPFDTPALLRVSLPKIWHVGLY